MATVSRRGSFFRFPGPQGPTCWVALFLKGKLLWGKGGAAHHRGLASLECVMYTCVAVC